jgi:hypothetical protein
MVKSEPSIVGRFVDTANGGQSGSLKTPMAIRVSAFQFDGQGLRRKASPTAARDSNSGDEKRSIG